MVGVSGAALGLKSAFPSWLAAVLEVFSRTLTLAFLPLFWRDVCGAFAHFRIVLCVLSLLAGLNPRPHFGARPVVLQPKEPGWVLMAVSGCEREVGGAV